jgi:capsular polysaccharide transport system permease protein
MSSTGWSVAWGAGCKGICWSGWGREATELSQGVKLCHGFCRWSLDTASSRAKQDPGKSGKQSRRSDGLRRLSGWQVQWRVVDALVYRELRTRVSDVKGGFLGVLMQPLGLILIWMSFLSLLNAHRGGSLNPVLFLASGIVLFTVFSQIANRSITAMEANEALLFYKPVKPIDTVIARTICEAGLYASCLIVICVGTWIVLDQVYLDNPGLFFFTILLAACFGFATGLLFMVAGHIIPNFKQAGQWIPRILWFISGVPFRYWNFRPWVKPFFVWNPFMHIIELNRKSMSNDYFTPDANIEYAVTGTLVLLTLSLWVYYNNERKLLTL